MKSTRRNQLKALGLSALGGLAPALMPGSARAQAAGFPAKPIRIIVPFAAGSGADSNSRAYGEIMGRMLGTTVLVENRPGGSGFVAIAAVKAAPADGHTILMATNSPMVVNAVTMKDLPYDPVKDFRPVHGLSRGPVAFIARGDTPYKTVKEMIEATKKSGKPLIVGNYSAGYQLVAAWLGTAGGVEITHVAYKGGAQVHNDVVGGQLPLGAVDFSGAIPLLKDGRLRVLGLTDDARLAAFPDIPTLKETGFPDFATWVWSSFFVRTETPDDITDKLVDTTRKALLSPEGRAYQASQPTPPMMFGPDDMRKFQLAELDRFRKVADAAGIKPQ